VIEPQSRGIEVVRMRLTQYRGMLELNPGCDTLGTSKGSLVRLIGVLLFLLSIAPLSLMGQPLYMNRIDAEHHSHCSAPGLCVGVFPSTSPKKETFSSLPSSTGTQKPVAPIESQGKKRQKRKYSPSANTGSPGHIFWVVPAYKVNYGKNFKPLSPREKFQQWAEGVYDPLGLATGVVEAGTLQYSSTDGFCGYGHDAAAFGECYGSMELDAVDSSFIGDYALTVLLHQDPRYFRLGRGSMGRRVLYSISRVFITYNDAGRNTFYTSALTGTVVAAAVSNLYYPQQDRGWAPTVSRIGIDLGNTEIYNGAAEFWPDFDRAFHHVLHRVRSRATGFALP
jgi:hypothetical protein